jgi:thiol-disulfide isomerase/thioredoxin
MIKKQLAFIFLVIFIANVHGQQRKSKIGTKAPKLKIEKFYSSNNASSNIDELKGKLVILDFWGSWCSPCIESFFHMNNLVDQFKDQPVQFITIGYEDTDKAKKILDKHGVLSWKAIDTDLSSFTDYEAWAIPLMVVINQKGIIVGEFHPENFTEEVLKMALEGKKIQDKKDGSLPYFDPDRAKEHFLNAVKK